MFGYMTEREAAEKGFTHHARYYSLPVWYAQDGPYGATVEPKRRIFEWMIWVICCIESIFRTIIYPQYEPVFKITIVKPIGREAE